MTISIIIPVYNVEKYIIRCLESVKSQTFSDFEVILVDDCGQDNSISLIKEYINKNNLINYTIVHHHKNRGLSAARNTGIKIAKGKYIYFLDSDDTISPNCIELLFQSINGTDADFVMGKIASVSPDNIKVLCKKITYNYDQYSTDSLIKLYINDQIPWNAVNRLIKLDFITKNNLFFEDGITSEDLLWNFKILPFVSTAILINDVTYFYYVTPNSIMTNASHSEKFAIDLIKIGELTNLYQNNFPNKLYKKYYIYIKHTFIPYAILWHKYNNSFRYNMLYKNLSNRFDNYLHLPLIIKLYYLFPRKTIPYILRAFFLFNEYKQIILTKINQKLNQLRLTHPNNSIR